MLMAPDGRRSDGSRSIKVQTAKGNDITNFQDYAVPQHRLDAQEAAEAKFFREKFTAMEQRRRPTSLYNCHGMTFASRRTGIYDPEEIKIVLQDDGYDRVAKAEVMPGDVALYFEGPELIHSGVVVSLVSISASSKSTVPIVLSKWGCGGEYVHRFDICMYFGREGQHIHYYREGQNVR